MASVTTATSEWIQFFKDAGIPAGLAVNYAVSFVDNRIQKNMLMDLSKDIMIDLGITVIGDVIAILKHAKQVYRQDMCKMATEAISAGQTSVQAELRRTANTPAARMIANALSHDSPPATPTRRSDSRLSVTVSNSQANKNKAVLSQPADEGSSLPAAKRRRVTAEMEGKYIVNMPKGTTPRTRRILAQQAKKGLKRTSVFERLGAESMADTTTNNNKPTGVFSRLDGGDENGVLRSGSTAAYMDEDDEDSNEEGSVLQYAGVLKTIPSKKKASKRAAPTALRRLGGKFKQPPSDIPTSSSASSLKSHPAAKISVLQRLGKPLSTNESVSATPADTQDNRVTSTRSRASGKSSMASCKVSSSTGAGGAAAGVGEPGGAKMDIKAVSVFKRLGSKKP
uniref:Chromosome 19 open reading frame 47 n=1 Tax=Nothobranchius pienaari TaxID=704102 RepID=A0A1A8M1T1_9TELE